MSDMIVMPNNLVCKLTEFIDVIKQGNDYAHLCGEQIPKHTVDVLMRCLIYFDKTLTSSISPYVYRCETKFYAGGKKCACACCKE